MMKGGLPDSCLLEKEKAYGSRSYTFLQKGQSDTISSFGVI